MGMSAWECLWWLMWHGQLIPANAETCKLDGCSRSHAGVTSVMSGSAAGPETDQGASGTAAPALAASPRTLNVNVSFLGHVASRKPSLEKHRPARPPRRRRRCRLPPVCCRQSAASLPTLSPLRIRSGGSVDHTIHRRAGQAPAKQGAGHHTGSGLLLIHGRLRHSAFFASGTLPAAACRYAS